MASDNHRTTGDPNAPADLNALVWHQRVRNAVAEWLKRWGVLLSVSTVILMGIGLYIADRIEKAEKALLDSKFETLGATLEGHKDALTERLEGHKDALTERMDGHANTLNEKIDGQAALMRTEFGHVDEKLDDIEEDIDRLNRRIDGVDDADRAAGR